MTSGETTNFGDQLLQLLAGRGRELERCIFSSAAIERSMTRAPCETFHLIATKPSQ
jgi:hypothetical protein